MVLEFILYTHTPRNTPILQIVSEKYFEFTGDPLYICVVVPTVREYRTKKKKEEMNNSK